MSKSKSKSQFDGEVGSAVRRETHAVVGDGTEQLVIHEVTGHVSGGIELIYPDGTVGSMSICQRPAGSSARGQELSSMIFSSPDVDADGNAHEIVTVPHFDCTELVFYITSAADLVAKTESH